MNTECVFKQIEKICAKQKGFVKEDAAVFLGDSLEVLKNLPDKSISLILTDPPYHSTQKKNIFGDTLFKNDDEYVEWLQRFSSEWKRVLKNNGSVFCFCSSAMVSKLELMFSNEFNILSQIVWTKPNAPGYDGWKQKMKKESLRQWYAHSERIIFMEPNLEGNLYQSYFGVMLKEWRQEAELSGHQLTEMIGAYGKINHGGAVSNWEAGRNIPNKEQYEKIRQAIISTGKVKSIPDYEDVIRPFCVNKNMEFTDVWNFENVRPYKGKHPAEKPQDLLQHAIRATTYPGDIVLDCFAGSGATAIAANELGRRSVSIEIESEWYNYICNRIADCFEYEQLSFMC
ncbi:MAG: site-specific DNA-methyltransferase [Lachnoclostridium sp.]|nr:site-specific DNA-methyltransferase [Lachnospira sp.]MCM1248264.1 site-specific DNA-methyltransferase [Lachnoclostridium sp.]